MIYLASPYTHEIPEVREGRYWTVCHAAGYWMEKGFFVYSPIAHTHGVCVADGGQKFTFDYWKKFDEHMIDLCEEFWIVQMDGWQDSNGIKQELAYALSKGKPVKYV